MDPGPSMAIPGTLKPGRTWSCRKSCRPSDTKLLEFDFQYKELPCREVIPWRLCCSGASGIGLGL